MTPYNVELPNGRVRVDGPIGAEVFVEGELVGELPLERAVEVSVGVRQIVVRHEGREWRRNVDVTLGEPAVITIDASDAGRAQRS